MSAREHLLNAAKGSLIGAANTIPGVSGGTIAVITGLYDRLIESIGGFFRTGWKRNLLFLVPVAVGVLVGLALFASGVEFFLDRYPIQTAFFFIGLILGSLPALFKITLREPFRPGYLIPFALALGALVAMTIAGPPPSSAPITVVTVQSGVLIFLAGMIATATMIVPGISGSFVLLLIGMYSTFISAIAELNVPVLAVLFPGFVAGIVLVSRLLRLLLSRFHALAYWTIMGLVIGSVLAIWPRGATGTWLLPVGAGPILASIGAFAAGALPAYFLGVDKRENKKKAH